MIPDPAQVIDPSTRSRSTTSRPRASTSPSAGAIANQAEFDVVGTIRIADSTVAGNFATHDGAGIPNAGHGILIIERSTISDNTTEAAGGGIYSNGGTVTITDSTISGNNAHDGGGIYSDGASSRRPAQPRHASPARRSRTTSPRPPAAAWSTAATRSSRSPTSPSPATRPATPAAASQRGRASMTLTRVTFTDNDANGEGGGAWTGSERLVTIQRLRRSPATRPACPSDQATCSATPAGANIAGGGGLYTEGGPVAITGSTFADNTATEEGGGISIDNFGDVTISDSVIRDNRAGTDGGGIENSGMRVTFERLLVTGNRADARRRRHLQLVERRVHHPRHDDRAEQRP